MCIHYPVIVLSFCYSRHRRIEFFYRCSRARAAVICARARKSYKLMTAIFGPQIARKIAVVD